MFRQALVGFLGILGFGGLCVADGAEIPRGIRRALTRQGVAIVMIELEAQGRLRATGTRPPDPFRASQDRVIARLPEGCAVRHRYRFSPTLALKITSEDALESLAAIPDVTNLTLDAGGRGALVESRALIRANEVFDFGVTGDNRVVAILDTGVDTDHPDLAGTVLHAYHFIGDNDKGPGAEDDHGHGTHVAGIIASRGVESPRGIAPGSRIVAIKVLSANNRGFLTDWAAGVEHVIGLHEDGLRIDVINMSLQSDALYPGLCDGTILALRNACRAAKSRGILVVASSGDSGSPEGMRSPACYGSVVAVGSSVDVAPDRISSFTDRNGLLDILAPGEVITSAGLGGGQVTVAGTSQACAHVSGVVLLIREVAPELDPGRILALLESTGVPVGDAATGLSFPRVDVFQAITELTGFEDCDGNGRPDPLDPDRNHNRVPDACEGPPYLRGDTNTDGDVDLSDPIRIFEVLFGGDPDLPCESAADSNADGQVNLTDSIYTLNFLFAGGAAPPPPYPECGLDEALDGPLRCVSYAPCRN